MSKDAKISFMQTVGVMIISAVLIVTGWIFGIGTGSCIEENRKLREELELKEK